MSLGAQGEDRRRSEFKLQQRGMRLAGRKKNTRMGKTDNGI